MRDSDQEEANEASRRAVGAVGAVASRNDPAATAAWVLGMDPSRVTVRNVRAWGYVYARVEVEGLTAEEWERGVQKFLGTSYLLARPGRV